MKKILLLSIILMFSITAFGQYEMDFAFHTPAKDTLWLLECDMGALTKHIWDIEPIDQDGCCPTIIFVDDLYAIRSRFLSFNSVIE